jgi:hypothetical protein
MTYLLKERSIEFLAAEDFFEAKKCLAFGLHLLIFVVFKNFILVGKHYLSG